MVLVSSTFSLVAEVIFELYIISSPANVNLFSCLTACYQHQDCGGIIKHEKENFKCEFVVDASVSGATPSSSRTAYRLNTYGNKKLLEASTDDAVVSIDDVDELCKNDNLLTPNYPTTKKNFKCEFVVDASVSGATPSSSGTAYRLNTYGNKKLIDTSIDDRYVSIDDVDELCKNDNLLTPNYPTTKKQRTVLNLRNKRTVTLNLKRQPDGSFQNSEGEITSENIIEWAPGNPDDGEEDCMRLGIRDDKFVTSDSYCDLMRATSTMTLFCV